MKTFFTALLVLATAPGLALAQPDAPEAPAIPSLPPVLTMPVPATDAGYPPAADGGGPAERQARSAESAEGAAEPPPTPPPPESQPSAETAPSASEAQPATTPPPSPETAPSTQPATDASDADTMIKEMPEFLGIEAWINSEPLTRESLKGKVVLVDFWTYSCINCIRTLPYLNDWYKKYRDRGFVIVGVHSPEFEFEKDLNNVKAAVQRYGILYPVALDNQMGTWAAYKNGVWPAHYFIDAAGKVRHIHLGEGEYERSEQMIQKLLAETEKKPETQPSETQPAETQPSAKKDKNEGPTPETKPMPELSKIPSAVDFTQIKSPETYLGLMRRERLVTSGRPIELNEWTFQGKWRTEGHRIVLAEGTGKIALRFNATKVYLVMAPTAGGVQAVVKLDGQPLPQAQAGADVKNGTVMLTEPRMYELIDLGKQSSEHVVEIEFLNPGAAAYAFTFG